MKQQQSNVIEFPGRPLPTVTEQKVKKFEKLSEFAKEYGPTAFYALLWVLFIIVANL
jgi:hypothetical protein